MIKFDKINMICKYVIIKKCLLALFPENKIFEMREVPNRILSPIRERCTNTVIEETVVSALLQFLLLKGFFFSETSDPFWIIFPEMVHFLYKLIEIL